MSSPIPLDFFFSFRSPYSYLAAPRVFGLPSEFDVAVTLRGIPPMVKRGVPLSRPKMRYIFADCARLARKLGMPFGRFADPLGAGAERCLKVSELAKSKGVADRFVLRVSRSIWSEGVEVAADRGLRPLCEEVGLDWEECREALSDPARWSAIGENGAALAALGQWGVPTVSVEGEPFWGQDRIDALRWRLEQKGLKRTGRTC